MAYTNSIFILIYYFKVTQIEQRNNTKLRHQSMTLGEKNLENPNKIQILVVNAVGQLIPNATVKLVIRRGSEWIEEKPDAITPVTHDLRPGFIQVEVDAKAPDYYAEKGIITFGVTTLRWACTNPAWLLSEENGIVVLKVALGRIRFAPIVIKPEDLQVQVPYNPGGVLVSGNQYRTLGLERKEKIRTVQNPAIKDPNNAGWDRFHWDPQEIQLSNLGNWLMLEYGDPDNHQDSLRHLIGVWAPNSYPGMNPPVVVQITPNTHPPNYPNDGLPFSGIYPYGCTTRPGKKTDDKTGKIALHDCGQSYVELTSNRSFGQYKIVYQLYAARPDIFTKEGLGPIVITLSPAVLRDGSILREPFTHREAIGRLIAEVLRFLWSRQLTIDMVGLTRLRFQGSDVKIGQVIRPDAGPNGFPKRTLTTVLCHSAAVGPVLQLAGHASSNAIPSLKQNKKTIKEFPASLWGGPNEYCDQCWKNLWVIDGVGNPGSIGVPAPGSTTVKTWKNWLNSRDDRRIVCVYTEAGLGENVEAPPELVRLTNPRIKGKAGWIEEGYNKKVSWLRISYSYLKVQNPLEPKGILPQFGDFNSDGKQIHDKIYEFGVGYAARFRR
ncbi:hypothetical protein QUF99_13870 [Bacillus sp. DX4.1]|uniref:hypothetical protein n=1 Tax=Bacillus sp. DX4.1 TaxID=3055867 RepID=UPI0025A1EB7B|nr:hypothetical protein [Bacillus sp. DX4.1]MDM5188368.1 hypothetical protein [Bacillus sp. DX4.1]